ncbi:MAG TPA: DsbA family protein [Halobacteriales archaeon]|nr:DsbA family protein [Halobacteriales archaeon]
MDRRGAVTSGTMGAEIVQFADPLNPLGWVAEPTRRRVALAYPDAAWTVRPVGMVESWDAYDGPEVQGGRAGVAATCARLAEQYGMPIDEYLWFDDPPESSWPACRAIAAAGLQDEGDAEDRTGPGLATRLLRACREATFARRRSISDDAALRAVIESVPDLDADALATALDDGRADDAFRAAREAARELDAPGVERAGDRPVLPTLVVRADGDARAVSGVTDVAAVREAFEAVAGIEPADETAGVGQLIERFSAEGWVSRAELEHLTGRSPDEVEATVAELVDSGEVVGETYAAEPFWRLRAYVPEEEMDDASGEVDGAESDEATEPTGSTSESS